MKNKSEEPKYALLGISRFLVLCKQEVQISNGSCGILFNL